MNLCWPLALQAAIMGLDEFWCHRRRLLRRWERVGHPLDTLSFLACLLWTYWLPPSSRTLLGFLGLAVFSSVLITKDEWQHRELCGGFEHWLHSLLFLLHSVVLAALGVEWWTSAPGLSAVVAVAATAVGAFALYQTVYWNVIRAH